MVAKSAFVCTLCEIDQLVHSWCMPVSSCLLLCNPALSLSLWAFLRMNSTMTICARAYTLTLLCNYVYSSVHIPLTQQLYYALHKNMRAGYTYAQP